MAVFRQYNIQLLPLDTRRTEEVGVAGYKKLFEMFQTYTTNAYKMKLMAKEAKPLVNDAYICPFVVHVDADFAYGKFIKYHMAETVTEFYTQERLFEARKGDTAVSNTYYFRFAFDYEWHRLAIEENGNKLPSPDVMKGALEHFLARIAAHGFPKHVLKINLISDQRTLDEVLVEGNEFGPVDVKIAFPNGGRLTETLRELKSINAHSMHAHVSPARGARMSGLPTYIRDLLKSAPDWGEAKVVFYKQLKNAKAAAGNFKKKIYSTSEHPRTFRLKPINTEDESGFIQRVLRTMKTRAKNEDD